jgi:D-sedoheptulose 7-phosphate isomerase
VLAGAAAARRLKLPVVALAGPGGGQLKDLADVCIRIPSASVPRVQEAHGAIIHIWCGIIEEDLFPDSRKVH